MPGTGQGAISWWAFGSQKPRRRKTKSIISGGSLAINRPPLRGFKPSRAVAEIWGGPRFALVSLKKPPRRCGNDKVGNLRYVELPGVCQWPCAETADNPFQKHAHGALFCFSAPVRIILINTDGFLTRLP